MVRTSTRFLGQPNQNDALHRADLLACNKTTRVHGDHGHSGRRSTAPSASCYGRPEQLKGEDEIPSSPRGHARGSVESLVAAVAGERERDRRLLEVEEDVDPGVEDPSAPAVCTDEAEVDGEALRHGGEAKRLRWPWCLTGDGDDGARQRGETTRNGKRGNRE
jgi:hypothetical protein